MIPALREYLPEDKLTAMADLPKLSRSMRASTDLDIRRELANRPEDRPTLQMFRSKEAKR